MSNYHENLYSKGYGIKSRDLPPLALLLEQQPCRDRAEISRNLGIAPRTLQRYEFEQHAPRAVMLALYYESSHGKENAYRELFNDARAAWQLANSLQARDLQQSKIFNSLACCSGIAANAAIFCNQLDLFVQLGSDIAA